MVSRVSLVIGEDLGPPPLPLRVYVGSRCRPLHIRVSASLLGRIFLRRIVAELLLVCLTGCCQLTIFCCGGLVVMVMRVYRLGLVQLLLQLRFGSVHLSSAFLTNPQARRSPDKSAFFITVRVCGLL
uniref:Uncharacterized protein n=1 Tax=Knipowitschia caucasica TaxID=637954 RepID=A0AAV2JV27_KNICA